jgi:hypothetical protein
MLFVCLYVNPFIIARQRLGKNVTDASNTTGARGSVVG